MLSDYRVLDLADDKGVVCGMLLAQLGAEVVKIEPPSGDRGRYRGPYFHDEIDIEKSFHFLFYNVGKRSITLNLEHSNGRALFKDLIKSADVLVESYIPGYLHDLGLDYQNLREINPRLVMVSITPFGQTGPHAQYLGTDLTIMATSGHMQMVGSPEKPPVRLGGEHSHWPPSQYAAIGVAGALYHRDFLSGEGQHVDVSMQEAMLAHYFENHPALTWRAQSVNVIRPGYQSPVNIPYGVYPARDGWVQITLPFAAEWESLALWIYEVTGNEEVLNPKYRGRPMDRGIYGEELNGMVTAFTVQVDKWTLFHEGQKRNLAIVPACTVDDVLMDPHLVSTGFWIELDHPVVGKLKYPRISIESSHIPTQQKAAPLLGEDNEAIYCQEMGLTRGDLTRLRGLGAI